MLCTQSQKYFMARFIFLMQNLLSGSDTEADQAKEISKTPTKVKLYKKKSEARETI